MKLNSKTLFIALALLIAVMFSLKLLLPGNNNASQPDIYRLFAKDGLMDIL